MKELNQWDIKFLREQPFMAFGSLLNGYAQMHQQRPVAMAKFERDARRLFQLAQELAKKALEENQEGVSDKEGPDFPVK